MGGEAEGPDTLSPREFEVRPGDSLTGFSIRLGWKDTPAPRPEFPSGTARILLQVVDQVTKKPVPRAEVMVSPKSVIWGPPSIHSACDGNGVFFLSNIPPGPYSVWVQHRGYARTSTLVPEWGAECSISAAPDTSTPETIDLVPAAVLTGRAVTPFLGMPVRIWLIQRKVSGGVISLARLLFPIDTDALGYYRIAGLPAGEYAIGAPGLTETPTYLGGSADPAGAQFVSAQAGRQVSAPDLVVAPPPTRRVSGVLRDSAGNPLAKLHLVARMARIDAPMSPVEGQTDEAGHFAFDGLQEGVYTLVLYRETEDLLEFKVGDRDLTDLALVAAPTFSIKFAITCGGCSVASLGGAHVEVVRNLGLYWSSSNRTDALRHAPLQAPVFSDATASFDGLSRGRYFIRIRGIIGYSIDSIQQDGENIFDGKTIFIDHGGRLSIVVKHSGQ